MISSQFDLDATVLQLPTHAQVVTGQSWSLTDLARQVVKISGGCGVVLAPVDAVLPDALAEFVSVFSTQLPDPLDPDGDAVAHFVVAACGEWTACRTDSFIAAMAGWRVGSACRFDFFATHAVPDEVRYLFESPVAGVLELVAWEIAGSGGLASDGVPERAARGRQALARLYDVDLEPSDLQWVSVANQLVLEEIRWFSDDPREVLPDRVDYVPHASLTLLGSVAGEAIRLNHEDELEWRCGEGMDWPELVQKGSDSALRVIDYVFRRFELGYGADLWDTYEAFFAVGQLAPPVSMEMSIDPLQLLPGWDPTAGMPFGAAVEEFLEQCRATGLVVEPHPLGDASAELDGFLAAFSTNVEGVEYSLFVCSEAWDEDRQRAFIGTYGRHSMRDWEIGTTPVFVFFSGHPLPELLDWCHVSGPPVAPLEGLARVETPAPEMPRDEAAIHAAALWFIHTLEQFSTIGIDLDSTSVLPGLEFFVREELKPDTAMVPPEARPRGFEPVALLVCTGITAGESVRLRYPDRCTWGFNGAPWPVMTIDGGESFDWVERARLIFTGDADEFEFQIG